MIKYTRLCSIHNSFENISSRIKNANNKEKIYEIVGEIRQSFEKGKQALKEMSDEFCENLRFWPGDKAITPDSPELLPLTSYRVTRRSSGSYDIIYDKSLVPGIKITGNFAPDSLETCRENALHSLDVMRNHLKGLSAQTEMAWDLMEMGKIPIDRDNAYRLVRPTQSRSTGIVITYELLRSFEIQDQILKNMIYFKNATESD